MRRNVVCLYFSLEQTALMVEALAQFAQTETGERRDQCELLRALLECFSRPPIQAIPGE